MTFIINNKTDKKEFEQKLQLLIKNRSKKVVHTMKFCGTITLKKDPLQIQKEMRDEWE